MRVLVIAPHPDDEVLGCGGTIAKYSRKGDEVNLCIITKAYIPDWPEEFLKKRSQEIEQAKEVLGINKVYFLDFPTAKLDTVLQKELNRAILKVVNEIKPEIVYIPHQGDLSKDHRLVFEASLVASRPINSSVKRVLSYETLSETEWGIEKFLPDTYENIEQEIETKLKAMKSYHSELKEFPNPRSLTAIKCLAEKRGLEVGLKFAESFKLIREIYE